MDMVLRGLTWASVLVYIDDIIVYVRSHKKLKEHLREVFECLKQANLKLKPNKVKQFQREITFLRHRISVMWVAMDEDEV